MKFKHVLVTLAALISFSFFTSVEETSAATNEELLKQVKFYDENDVEIHPYTMEELAEIVQFNQEPTISPLTIFGDYDFRSYKMNSFSFSSNMWIGGGAYGGVAFYNPHHVDLYVTGEAPSMKLTAFGDDNGSVGQAFKSISLPGGWTNNVMISNWNTLYKGPKYRFRLDNLDGKKLLFQRYMFTMIQQK